jgi:hypothetical protein
MKRIKKQRLERAGWVVGELKCFDFNATTCGSPVWTTLELSMGFAHQITTPGARLVESR